jgi:hypothetical protein
MRRSARVALAVRATDWRSACFGRKRRLLAEDNVAVGHAIAFKVETFTPTETFRPTKPYVTRVKWRDHDGTEQSKLLLLRKAHRGGRHEHAGNRARSTPSAASDESSWSHRPRR